jgi:nicotinate phosphoribosyltransferase
VFEFGARRVDPLTAPYAGRAAYIAGCAATSCEQAGLTFGVPVSGTIAHSYVLAHVDDGEEAWPSSASRSPFPRAPPCSSTPTTPAAARCGRPARARRVRAVRIDSGDLLALGRDVRRILDAAGRPDIQLIASDDLDEQRIRSLLAEGAPYDAFGVSCRFGGHPLVRHAARLTLGFARWRSPQAIARGRPRSRGGFRQVLRRCDRGHGCFGGTAAPGTGESSTR